MVRVGDPWDWARRAFAAAAFAELENPPAVNWDALDGGASLLKPVQLFAFRNDANDTMSSVRNNGAGAVTTRFFRGGVLIGGD